MSEESKPRESEAAGRRTLFVRNAQTVYVFAFGRLSFHLVQERIRGGGGKERVYDFRQERIGPVVLGPY